MGKVYNILLAMFAATGYDWCYCHDVRAVC